MSRGNNLAGIVGSRERSQKYALSERGCKPLPQGKRRENGKELYLWRHWVGRMIYFLWGDVRKRKIF